MKESVIVISEYDYDDQESGIIGVASSQKEAEKMIISYYGDPLLLDRHYYEDSNVVYTQKLMVTDVDFGQYKVLITLERFNLNEI